MAADTPRYFPDEAVPQTSPFSPGFGATPPYPVGRAELIRSVCALLAGDPASEGGANMLLGPRGIGKTVMLNEIEDAAQTERGWIVLSLSGTDGDPIAETHKAVLQARSRIEAHDGEPAKRKLSGIHVGAAGLSAGASFERESSIRRANYGDDLRRDLAELVDSAAQSGSRVLLTMDEMHAIALPKTRKLGSCIQHIAKRERAPLVFVGAALPYITETMLADRKSTFLQRLVVHHLDPLSDAETRRGLREPIREYGGSINDDALAVATQAVAGHPYMLQLVGDRMWRTAGGADGPINVGHAKTAVAQARASLEDHLFAPTWRNLSDTDKRFLAALAFLTEHDDSPRVVTIANKAGVSKASVSAYRRRSLLSGMARPAGRGRLNLAHPSIGPWLRRAVASGELQVPEPPSPGI